MNWLTNYVRPKLREILNRPEKETPDNLWVKCANCGQMIFHTEFEENFHVCSYCQHHHRVGPEERFKWLFDDQEWDQVAVASGDEDDPLKFRDKKKYPDRLKEARSKTGQQDSVVVAAGKIEGVETVTLVQNFHFMAGSLGQGAGDAFLTGVREALARKAPFVIFTASGGARMQEGILSLMQMPRSTVGVEMLREAGLPYIVVLTDPTTGGVMASYAMIGDVHIAEPGALIGFAGRRVIEDTIREQLPDGFQRSEYLLEHGMVDMVVERRNMRETLGRVLGLLMRQTSEEQDLPRLTDQELDEDMVVPEAAAPVPEEIMPEAEDEAVIKEADVAGER